MRTKYFEYVKEIASCGSITKAAENLYISQQAVSEALKLLEDELGFQIFSRSNKGVQITKDGEKFLADLDVVLSILDGWRQMGKEKEHIKVKIYLQYLLNDLMMHEPLKVLSLYDVDWEPCSVYDVFDLTAHNKNSIGIISANKGTPTEQALIDWLKQKGRRADVLANGNMCVVLQKDDPLCEKAILQQEDFYGRQMVTAKIFGRTKHIQNFIETTGREAYLLPETINVLMFLTHAEKGSFSYVPEEIVKQSSQVKNGNLVLRQLERDKLNTMEYYLLYHEEHVVQNTDVIRKIKNYFKTI